MSFEDLKGTWYVIDSSTSHEATGHAVVIEGSPEAPTVFCHHLGSTHRYMGPSYQTRSASIQGRFSDGHTYEIRRVEAEAPGRRIKCSVSSGERPGPGDVGSWTADDNPDPGG